MNQPPSFLTLEIEEQDVYADLSSILQSMMQMRMQSVKEKKFSDEEKDEYLHLTYRFASGLEAIADDTMTDHLQKVAGSLDKNEELFLYDPLQDGYWKQQGEKEFVSSLDELAVAVSRDDFHDLDVKHHILQAIKYLGTRNEPAEVKDKVFETIQPFHGGISVSKESLSKKIAGFFFGIRCKTERVNPLTLRVDGPLEFLDDILRAASKKGYVNVQMPIHFVEFEKLSFPGKKILGEARNVFESDMETRLFEYTKAISYPLLGLLPQSTQRNIENRIPSYSPEVGFFASFIAEAFAFVGLTAAWHFTDNNSYIVATSAVCLDLVIRASFLIGRQEHVGSYMAKLALYPFEENNKRVRASLAEFPVRKPVSYQEFRSPLPYFEALCAVDVPREIEDSLVPAPGNHHSFSKKFRSYVEEKAEYNPKELKMNVESVRNEGALAYHQEVKVDDYTKMSSLICFPQERYILTTISKKPLEKYVETLIPALKGEGEVAEKTATLADSVNAKYIHLRRFVGGNMTHDLEGAQ